MCNMIPKGDDDIYRRYPRYGWERWVDLDAWILQAYDENGECVAECAIPGEALQALFNKTPLLVTPYLHHSSMYAEMRERKNENQR